MRDWIAFAAGFVTACVSITFGVFLRGMGGYR